MEGSRRPGQGICLPRIAKIQGPKEPGLTRASSNKRTREERAGQWEAASRTRGGSVGYTHENVAEGEAAVPGLSRSTWQVRPTLKLQKGF